MAVVIGICVKYPRGRSEPAPDGKCNGNNGHARMKRVIRDTDKYIHRQLNTRVAGWVLPGPHGGTTCGPWQPRFLVLASSARDTSAAFIKPTSPQLPLHFGA